MLKLSQTDMKDIRMAMSYNNTTKMFVFNIYRGSTREQLVEFELTNENTINVGSSILEGVLIVDTLTEDEDTFINKEIQ